MQLAIAPPDAPARDHPENLRAVRPGDHLVVAWADDVEVRMCVQVVEGDGHRWHGPAVWDSTSRMVWPVDTPELSWVWVAPEAVWETHDPDWHDDDQGDDWTELHGAQAAQDPGTLP